MNSSLAPERSELSIDQRLVEGICSDKMDVLPVEGRDMGPDLRGNHTAVALQPLRGGSEVAGVENDDGVEHEAERGGATELGLGVTIGEPSLPAEADGPSHGVHPLLLVEAHQYPAAENRVVHIGKDVAGLGGMAEFLDRLLERVLAPPGPQLSHD